MEVEEIQAQTCKFPRVANGRRDPDKVSTSTQDKHNHNNNNHYPHQHNTDDNKQDRELKMVPSGNSSAGGANDDLAGNINNRFRGWHHSSRIIRVSRSSGGKDRHSKVWTSKGLRDRRVRLSVATAIQFYDLQDRLGYDQPSKAVEWLIKAAADSIAELPALNSPFPETPRQPSDEKHTSGDTEQGQLDSAEVELDVDGGLQQQQNQHLSLSKSACSSTSETSKGSGLSLSRSDIRESRVKRRERARERTAKEKEKEKENESRIAQNVNPISQNASFTELLTGGGISSMVSNHHANSPTQHFPVTEANFFQKQAAARQWPTAPMDYFGSGFPGQIQLGNSVTQPMTFNGAGDNNHQELQHFPFIPDHNIMAAAAATSQPSAAGGSDYINFSISSSGLAGYHNNGNNRGTLQSNSSSPSFMPHLQRFPPIDGSSNIPFFIGTAAPPAAAPMENHHHHHHQHHQFPSGFDGRLQLYYTDRHPSDHKGKGKN